MAATPGNYTADQIKSFGLNPDETTSTQTVGGVTYKLDNNNQGGRILSVVGGNTSGSGISTNFNDAISQAIKMSQEAAKPAIETLQKQIDPLKSRYDELLKSIKGEQQVAENKQTVVTSNELGKRGILGSSTLAGQEIENALQPVRSSYSSLYANTGLQQEQALNAIAQAIASLQSGAASSGLSLGTNLYNTQVSQQQQALANEIAKQQLANETAKTNYEINKPYSTAGESLDLSSLIKSLGLDVSSGSSGNTIKPTSSFKPLSTSYTQSNKGSSYNSYA